MKTSGFKDYRLKKDDSYYSKEIKVLEEFNKSELEDLNSIIFGSDETLNPKDYLTEREEQIVLSFVQWLGTPVGQSFLERAFNDKK